MGGSAVPGVLDHSTHTAGRVRQGGVAADRKDNRQRQQRHQGDEPEVKPPAHASAFALAATVAMASTIWSQKTGGTSWPMPGMISSSAPGMLSAVS